MACIVCGRTKRDHGGIRNTCGVCCGQMNEDGTPFEPIGAYEYEPGDNAVCALCGNLMERVELYPRSPGLRRGWMHHAPELDDTGRGLSRRPVGVGDAAFRVDDLELRPRGRTCGHAQQHSDRSDHEPGR